MSVLDQIVEDKRAEVEANKKIVSFERLESKLNLTEVNYSLRTILLEGRTSGVIAEVKKKSPSRGVINDQIVVAEVAAGYEKAGASAISVLTDWKYFGGKDDDLRAARKRVKIPILRKDFIIDEYQIVEAKLMGADLILLIARILSPKRTEELTKFAKKLGLEVLLEVHSEKELLENINDDVDIVGVNNRDLDTLKVNLLFSFELATKIPDGFVKVSESGITTPDAVMKLREFGYNGFLMGENFMKNEQPDLACADFINKLG